MKCILPNIPHMTLDRDSVVAGFRSDWMPVVLPSHWNTAWLEYVEGLFQCHEITEQMYRELRAVPPSL